MAVARVQYVAGNNGTGGPFTLSLTSAVTSGNLLAVMVGQFLHNTSGAYIGGNWADLPVITDNTGVQNWNNVVADLYGRLSLDRRPACFVIPIVSSTTLQYITLYTPVPAVAFAVEYSGLHGILDVVTGGEFNVSTSWAAPALTTTGTGMILTWVETAIEPATFAAGSGYTLIAENDNSTGICAGGVVERLNTSAATYTPNGTIAAVHGVGAYAVALK